MLTTSPHTLKTKRLVLAQVEVCMGCCCGQTSRGKPEVPVEWLKSEWRKRGLLKNVQLTISGCLGPCDVPNVVKISSIEGEIWLGNIDRYEQYGALLDWACDTRAANRILPLPENLADRTLDPYR